MRKILTSRNFRFLTIPQTDSPPEELVVTPDLPREGESEGSMLPTISDQRSTGNESDSLKRKRIVEEEANEPRKTSGKQVNYRYLHDPFPDEEEKLTKLISHQKKNNYMP
jgi:hypothetical protein